MSFFLPDARVIRWGLLWLRGRRSLEDWPLLLQTWPGGIHFHGNGELHNGADRRTWEGCTCPILCQWTPECLFSHLSPGCCSLGWGFGSGNQKEKHFVGLSQMRHFMTGLRVWEGEEAECTPAGGKQLLLRPVESSGSVKLNTCWAARGCVYFTVFTKYILMIGYGSFRWPFFADDNRVWRSCW